ncbi:unnamed protein product [Sphagnum compactum]
MKRGQISALTKDGYALFSPVTSSKVFWTSQYSNLAIISWIQSTAGVPIAFAALAAAAHQGIATPGLQLLATSRDVSLQLLGNIQKLAAAGCSNLTAAVSHCYNL